MASRKRYRLDRVAVGRPVSRPATWTFAGRAMRGTEHTYQVTDGNFTSRNAWEFIVREPKTRGERVEVRPRTTPSVKAWEELPDRSLTFSRATRGPARGKVYCQVALADVTGQRSKDVVRADERHALPAWFAPLEGRMRKKETVRPTKGTDGNALVVLGPPDDHAFMIRLFFATKVWILKERVALALLVAALLGGAAPATAQSAADTAGVRAAVLDYVEGFYQGDSTRIVRSVRADATKYGFFIPRNATAYEGEPMSFAEMNSYANSVKRNNRPAPATAPKEIEILDLSDQTAAAKLTAYWGIDYLHLARYDGRWMIVHVLWQTPPKAPK